MSSWGHRRTDCPWIPSSPVSHCLRTPLGKFLKSLNGKRSIQQFPSCRCGSVFDRAGCRCVGLCLEWHSFTHLSRKSPWSNKNPSRSWQPPGAVCATAKITNTSGGRADPSLNPAQNEELSAHIPFWKVCFLLLNSRIPEFRLQFQLHWHCLPAFLVMAFMDLFHAKQKYIPSLGVNGGVWEDFLVLRKVQAIFYQVFLPQFKAKCPLRASWVWSPTHAISSNEANTKYSLILFSDSFWRCWAWPKSLCCKK